jgi:hypothetical protein
MINFGIFESTEGRRYACHFLPEENMVEAVGPLPKSGDGTRGIVFERRAESEQEARQIIIDAIESSELK